MNSFVIANSKKCIGCRTCEAACVMAHSDGDILVKKRDLLKFNPRLKVIKTDNVSAPIQCRHCEDAPCANACPNGSIYNKDGKILINEDTCIGCKSCVVACPFGAIDMIEDKKDGKIVLQAGLKQKNEGTLENKGRVIANKCDLCDGRERGPACVEVCPTKALNFIEADKLKESIDEKRNKTAESLGRMV